MTDAIDHGHTTKAHRCYLPGTERIGTNMDRGSITCNLTSRTGRNFNPILTQVVEKLRSRP